ncbi:DapH/DapD/GlmU-related protein [Mobiluncus mulieris]|uniref:DapH/DapD/GlmU-related protein n=1 Tax=Mobiluncus mulieris TaxID=2052 RepID=UPI0014708299|nr:galactoside O-acetyltransferase [Mobiluncus mulieris]MCV0014738.1 galactoside O-acetyltransferase [Mobiluncus mulieris]NMW81522.1 galactoside O-acetyltransferase [Mobiluncus mulieris]
MTHYNTRGAAPLKATPRREGWEGGTPITIGNKVRLGANVLVLPGVTIGDNTVVGTGSVVTRNLPANVIAVGNPARVYRDLPTDT